MSDMELSSCRPVHGVVWHDDDNMFFVVKRHDGSYGVYGEENEFTYPLYESIDKYSCIDYVLY